MRRLAQRSTTLLVAAALSLEPTLAHAEEPPPPVGAPQGQPPPKGNAMFGSGVFGVVFGILNVAGGTTLAIIAVEEAGFLGSIPIAFGASFIAIGSLGIHYGKHRRQRYQAWQRGDYVAPPRVNPRDYPNRPPTGLGMLIPGMIVISAGIGFVGIFGPDLALDPYYQAPQAKALTIGGIIAIVSGTPLLTIGSIRLHRRIAWDTRTRKQLAPSLAPVPWVGERAFGLGLSGRF